MTKIKPDAVYESKLAYNKYIVYKMLTCVVGLIAKEMGGEILIMETKCVCVLN